MWEKEKWHPISLNRETNEKILDRAVARQLIRVHGEQAHLIALSEMLGTEDATHQKKWRRVLDLVDELNKGERI
jgi:hypothetical protein